MPTVCYRLRQSASFGMVCFSGMKRWYSSASSACPMLQPALLLCSENTASPRAFLFSQQLLVFHFTKRTLQKVNPWHFSQVCYFSQTAAHCTRGSEMRPFSHSNPLAQMGKRTQWLKEKGWVVAKLQLPHTSFVQPSRLSQTMLLFCKPCPYISLLSFVMLWKNKLFPLSARKKNLLLITFINKKTFLFCLLDLGDCSAASNRSYPSRHWHPECVGPLTTAPLRSEMLMCMPLLLQSTETALWDLFSLANPWSWPCVQEPCTICSSLFS